VHSWARDAILELLSSNSSSIQACRTAPIRIGGARASAEAIRKIVGPHMGCGPWGSWLVESLDKLPKAWLAWDPIEIETTLTTPDDFFNASSSTNNLLKLNSLLSIGWNKYLYPF